MTRRVADDWFETAELADGVTRIRERHVAPWLRCNIWHLRGRDRDLLIDTGMGLRSLVQELALLRGRPITAVITHSHFDHMGGLHELAERWGHAAEADVAAAPTAANTVADTGWVRAESFRALPWAGFDHSAYAVRPAPLTRLVAQGDVVDLGARRLAVLHLPGHSPGSIALHEERTGMLFSGDAAYDGPLVDNTYHSRPARLADSLRRLAELDVSVVHPGHLDSFGRETLIAIIGEYLAGGRRLEDEEGWLAAQSDRAEP